MTLRGSRNPLHRGRWCH